jgi:alpha-D-xyloside xylohydrolase
MNKKIKVATLLCLCGLFGNAQAKIVVTAQNENAVRVRIIADDAKAKDEIVFINNQHKTRFKREENDKLISVKTRRFTAVFSKVDSTFSVFNADGKLVVKSRPLTKQGEASFLSPENEHIYGTGQFQDGYLNIRGLSRKLTQVNTQISIPMILSSNGYALLWHNYGLTEYNPSTEKVVMTPSTADGESVTVNVTSTTGNKQERRNVHAFFADIDAPADGDYSLLIDVGQKMARKYYVAVDGKVMENFNNIWLPPTTSFITHLSKGRHKVEFRGDRNDKPVLGQRRVDASTTFCSPNADATDFTVFVGTADEAMASYRSLTGNAPLMPKWAMGYVHCRERYDSQQELLANAAEFRKRNIPLDMIVQDWQYWGKYGWNAMRFDEGKYPDPKLMVDSLHKENVRLMLSVWSKIDRNSELGKQTEQKGYYIKNTEWVDFFNPDAAKFYWNNYSARLLKPYHIDAWWQDATEPENDDLNGRLVNNGTMAGDDYRNVFPMYVNKTVYEGLRRDNPDNRAMILTRSGFSGMQRYATATWSGDVGFDWETLRRQIVGGLGMMASGLPWWTYDAGGFFRPQNQYASEDYHELLLRWVQTATFLPLMRVHGYMSQTEPWRYGERACKGIEKCIRLRSRLLPYIYSESAHVSFDGSTLMRPLVMDFADDEQALNQETEYMFGHSLLIAPVLQAKQKQQKVYLPKAVGGWYRFMANTAETALVNGGQYVNVDLQSPLNGGFLPVFVKAGSILPLGVEKQYSLQKTDEPIEIRVYPGADASFTLYDDEGTNYNYERGECARIKFSWNDSKAELSIGKREGRYQGMPNVMKFRVVVIGKNIDKVIEYNGNQVKI